MYQQFINYANLTRINRPIGIGLLFLPCLFGVLLAEKKAHLDFGNTLWLILLFAIGSTIMRSAGCIINDIFDQKFDRAVERTKNRPIASGQISQTQALILLAFLLSVGLIILLQFNNATIISGFVALALATTYPLMKRITYYPQFFLGLAFNFGIIMASLAIIGRITFSCITLYFAAIIWTLIYDTIYAYQDIEDDLKIGVKSSAIKFQSNPRYILSALNLVMLIAFFTVGFLQSLTWHFFLISSAACALLAQKIILCDFSNPQKCLKIFKENFWIGSLISIAIFLG